MSNLSARIMSTLWREASVAVVPELAEKRRDTILRYKNPLQRAGALGLHGVAHCTSGAILSFLAHPYESSGMSFVGSGWNSTVLRDDGSVTKIVRRTEMMGPERRASHIAKLRELIGQNALCLGDMVVNSTVCEISHPLSSRPVVAITQPYVEGYDALANPVSSDVKQQLKAFAVRSLDTMVPNGFAPDLVGPGNILVSKQGAGEQIQLVDTVALENLNVPNASFPSSVKKLIELAK